MKIWQLTPGHESKRCQALRVLNSSRAQLSSANMEVQATCSAGRPKAPWFKKLMARYCLNSVSLKDSSARNL